MFRLGRLRGALGPGIVFIIPWLDRHNRVDMRTKAFSVPPQQVSHCIRPLEWVIVTLGMSDTGRGVCVCKGIIFHFRK